MKAAQSIWYWPILALVFMLSVNGSAMSKIDFDATTVKHLEISNQIDIYLDPEGLKSIDDILAPEFSGFASNRKVFPSFGAFSGNAWFRFVIKNESIQAQNIFVSLESYVLQADLFEKTTSGLWKQLGTAGRLVENETFPNRMPAFQLNFTAQEQKELYMRVRGDIIYTVRLSLQTPENFFQVERVWHSYGGFYLGAIAMMILYNFFLWASTRDSTFFWYSVTITLVHGAIISLYSSNGEFFGFKAMGWHRNFPIICKIVGAACMIHFSRLFLQTAGTRYVDIFLKINVSACPIFLMLIFFIPAQRVNALSNLSLIPSLLVLIGYSARLSLRGVNFAKLYFMAWFPVLLLVTIQVFLNMIGKSHMITRLDFLVSIASLAEALLLSMALGDKINEIRKQKLEDERQHREEVLGLNRSLEQKVQQRTRDIRSMLDNLKIGIFTISEEGKLDQDYSKHLEKIFDKQNLSQFSPEELLFANADLGVDQINQVKCAISYSLGSHSLGFSGNESSFLHEFTRKLNGKTQHLEVDWACIESSTSITEKLLVSVKDVTEFNLLKQQRLQQSKKIEILALFLGPSGPHIGRLFESLQQAKLLYQRQTLAMEEQYPKMDQVDVVAEVFRSYHTAKALARKDKLFDLADAIHNIESYLQEIVQQKTRLDPIRIEPLLETIDSVIDGYTTILREFGLKLDMSHTTATARSFESYTMDILEERKSLARSLNKAVPSVKIVNDSEFIVDRNLAELLDSTLIHLLRNSLDHGIETVEDRIAKGKCPHGEICIELQVTSDKLIVCFHDDGRGLHLGEIKMKALKRNILRQEDADNLQKIAETIFTPDFSTKQNVSDISGRGVGLDAVAHAVRSKGGDLALELQEPSSPAESMFAPVRFQMQIPREVLVGSNRVA